MSDAKHTAGPWAAHTPNCGDGLGIYAGEKRVAHTSAVRNINGKPLTDAQLIEQEEANSNARLIASAPDLLAACKAIAYEEDRSANDGRDFLVGRHRFQKALDAIAKAEGAPQ